MQLAKAVYILTREFPREEMFGLTSQLRRASVSIPSNIAEGQGRISTGEFVQFLGIARGSNFEVQTQIQLARDVGLGQPESLARCESLSAEVGKMLNALIATLT
jgi:four helix bundle protein